MYKNIYFPHSLSTTDIMAEHLAQPIELGTVSHSLAQQGIADIEQESIPRDLNRQPSATPSSLAGAGTRPDECTNDGQETESYIKNEEDTESGSEEEFGSTEHVNAVKPYPEKSSESQEIECSLATFDTAEDARQWTVSPALNVRRVLTMSRTMTASATLTVTRATCMTVQSYVREQGSGGETGNDAGTGKQCDPAAQPHKICDSEITWDASSEQNETTTTHTAQCVTDVMEKKIDGKSKQYHELDPLERQEPDASILLTNQNSRKTISDRIQEPVSEKGMAGNDSSEPLELENVPHSLTAAAEHTGDNLETSGEHTSDSLETAAEHTGDNLETSGEHTSDSLETEAEHTGYNLKTPAEHTGDRLTTAAEHTGYNLETSGEHTGYNLKKALLNAPIHLAGPDPHVVDTQSDNAEEAAQTLEPETRDTVVETNDSTEHSEAVQLTPSLGSEASSHVSSEQDVTAHLILETKQQAVTLSEMNQPIPTQTEAAATEDPTDVPSPATPEVVRKPIHFTLNERKQNEDTQSAITEEQEEQRTEAREFVKNSSEIKEGASATNYLRESDSEESMDGSPTHTSSAKPTPRLRVASSQTKEEMMSSPIIIQNTTENFNETVSMKLLRDDETNSEKSSVESATVYPHREMEQESANRVEARTEDTTCTDLQSPLKVRRKPLHHDFPERERDEAMPLIVESTEGEVRESLGQETESSTSEETRNSNTDARESVDVTSYTDSSEENRESQSTLPSSEDTESPASYTPTIPQALGTLEAHEESHDLTTLESDVQQISSASVAHTRQWVTFVDEAGATSPHRSPTFLSNEASARALTEAAATTDVMYTDDRADIGENAFRESFGFSFLESPPDELFCLLCSSISQQPQQTMCCGRIYCNACLNQHMQSSNKCPKCQENVTSFTDLMSERRIKDLEVSCENKRNGCKWKGRLRELSDHVAQCELTTVQCRNTGCEMRCYRKLMEQHERDECLHRPYVCLHCDTQGPFNIVSGEHLMTCTRVPIPCPNEGCSEFIPRDSLAAHSEICPKQKVTCPYAPIGCSEEIARDRLEDHKQDGMRTHLDLAIIRLQLLSEKPEQEQYAPIVFKVENFQENWTNNSWWYSPSFYTHMRGYKLCLGVKIRGHKEGQNTHISLYALIMGGKNDENLVWPFRGELEIEILNQLENRGHYKETISFSQTSATISNSRVTLSGRSEKGLGSPYFIPHDQLGFNGDLYRQYLKDDCLFLKVKQVSVYESNRSWLGSELAGTQANERDLQESVLETRTPPIVHTLSYFEQIKTKSKGWFSSPFYSHMNGYKLCLCVYPNGVREGAGNHVSVYVYLMKGKNDAHLIWPFCGSITVELLNQKSDQTHHKGVIRFSDMQANVFNSRVVNGERGSGYGMTRFISHTQLAGTPQTQYLKSDSIIFRVTEVRVYPTNCPWLSSTKHLDFPTEVLRKIVRSTQNLQESIGDSCVPPRVYKIDGFEQLLSEGREWFGPPFYSHRGGYSMCLAVVPNGNDLGAGTHVSVYVHLERGKHDDSLQWPFRGEVTFELLNQSTNSHHRKGIAKFMQPEETICNARVDNADRSAGGVGYDTFISHEKLRNSRNCVYIKDNCVFLKVSRVTVYGQKHWLLQTD